MKLEYVLEQDDFVNYHLFLISESKKSKIFLNFMRVGITVAFLFMSYKIYNQGRMFLAVIAGCVAISFFLFFDKLYKSKLKKFYLEIVKKDYANKIGKLETIAFENEYLIANTKSGVGKIKLLEIEIINETQNNFFINISNNSTLIIPKRGIENIELVKQKWKDLKIPMADYLFWKW